MPESRDIGRAGTMVTGLAYAGGNLHIAVGPDNVVRALQSDGTLVTIAGVSRALCFDGDTPPAACHADALGHPTTAGCAGDGGPAALATFGGLGPLAIAPSGDLYVVDSGNHMARAITNP